MDTHSTSLLCFELTTWHSQTLKFTWDGMWESPRGDTDGLRFVMTGRPGLAKLLEQEWPLLVPRLVLDIEGIRKFVAELEDLLQDEDRTDWQLFIHREEEEQRTRCLECKRLLKEYQKIKPRKKNEHFNEDNKKKTQAVGFCFSESLVP